MSDVVVLGAGVSGHTAALHARRVLGKQHTITVISPNSHWNWIPSNIWVGVGKMGKEKVVFPLAPVYDRKGIQFRQAKALSIWPEGDSDSQRPSVEIEYTAKGKEGTTEKVHYDYLINATGPKLKFEATPGLGPDGHTVSVCSAEHAVEAAASLQSVIEKLKQGVKQTLVVGMGHGTCTCQGAAFEYVFNVEQELQKAGVRDLATLVFLTNEPTLGDFGMGGMVFDQKGSEVNSEVWAQSLFRERGVVVITGSHVERVDEGLIAYESLDGEHHELAFDFAMLIPPFSGVPLKAFKADGSDITSELFAPSGFMKVDADYTPKPYEEWKASDWPNTYQSPSYDNIYAVGIAFAPPHQISKPTKTANGTPIAPAPPRTGMPSGVMGRAVAMSIARRIKHGDQAKSLPASMANMGAACVASAGTGMLKGSAASMTVRPIVPDYDRYPTGRDTEDTSGDMGLAGHWVKYMLHHLFIYKAKGYPFWQFIPE
ncbi:MAG: sulfide:quinone reductase [Actinomycetales bacterium]|nr:MAG: sulfide:quinone reductase [Actinomycetales bacterium]